MQEPHPEIPSVEQSSSHWPRIAARKVETPIDCDSSAPPGNVTERERSEEAPRQRDALLAAVEFAAECLLTTPHWDDHVQEVLARLGVAVGVSRVYVAENRIDDGTLRTSWRYEWVTPGIPSGMDDPLFQDLPLNSAGLRRWADLLAQGQVVEGPVRSLPSRERAVLAPRGVRALAVAPIIVGQAWWGFIGLEECQSEREWSAAEIGTLKITAHALGAAILRQRVQTERLEFLLREQTARNAAEAVEHRFHDLVQGVDAIVWEANVGDAPFRFSFVSRRAEQMLGYPVERWLQEPHFLPGIIHPEDRARVVDFCLAAIAEGRDHDLEYRVLAADGREVWLREIVRVVVDSAGSPRHLHGLMVDITERRRSEAKRAQLIHEQAARAEAEMAQQRLAFLASASTVLSSSLDYATTLTQVARLAVPFLADGCAVDMLESDGTIRQLDLVCADNSRERLVRELQQRYSSELSATGANAHPVIDVLRSSEPKLWSEVTDGMLVTYARDRHELDLLRRLSLRSLMIVPLVARGRALGAMTFFTAESNRTYDALDLVVAEDLARRCALAIDNALLYHHANLTHQRLATLFDQMGDMAIFIDTSERIRMVNRTWCTFFGLTEAEAIGCPLRELRERTNVRNVDGSTSPHDEAASRVAMARRQVFQRQALVATPLGDRIVETVSAPIVDDAGSVIGALALLRDVTEQQRLNELERELVSTVAHDLRNPLGIILGHAQHHLQELAQHAGERAQYSSQLRSSLRAIVRQVNRMTRLVELYLDMARIESGQLQMRPEPSDLNLLLRAVVDRFLANTPNRTITLDVPSEPIIAWIESERIDQVLSNLLENAITHTSEGGEIRMTLRVVEDRGTPEAEIAVEDTGAGIGSADLPRLFTRFFRAMSPERRSRRGTGLGLYICKGIVEAHGGRIWATSKGLGRGSRFAFTLPLEPWGEPEL